MCETCDLSYDECICVPCRSCGHNTKPEDMYRGKCDLCEDQQMVRGII